MVEGETAQIQLRIVSSKGTYIRTLADDIGKALGCGAYLTQLRRTKNGIFNVEDAIKGKALQEEDAK